MHHEVPYGESTCSYDPDTTRSLTFDQMRCLRVTVDNVCVRGGISVGAPYVGSNAFVSMLGATPLSEATPLLLSPPHPRQDRWWYWDDESNF